MFVLQQSFPIPREEKKLVFNSRLVAYWVLFPGKSRARWKSSSEPLMS